MGGKRREERLRPAILGVVRPGDCAAYLEHDRSVVGRDLLERGQPSPVRATAPPVSPGWVTEYRSAHAPIHIARAEFVSSAPRPALAITGDPARRPAPNVLAAAVWLSPITPTSA